MKSGMSLVLLVVIAGVAFAANGAEDYAGQPAKHWHEVDTDFMNTFHNPMEGVTMGLDIRLREVYARNIFGLNDSFGDPTGNYNNYHWQRYRTRWSTKWALSEDVDFNTRLVWEFWGHCSPDDSFNPFFKEDYEFDEATWDHMNVQIRNAFDMPLTLTVGRQDIILGTGWLVLDGTPADGSRTIYFDAVRGTYELDEDSKLDLIYIQQYDDESKWLTPFNHGSVSERRHVTNYSDERGIIAYLTNKLNETHSNELYYIYKNEEASDFAKFNNKTGIDSDIHTIGTRFFGQLDDNWSYSAEFAKQWGDRGGNTMKGLGSNNKLTYAFNDDSKTEVFVMYEYLSGDDPSTSADEKFETLWGDWPQYDRGGDAQAYIWTVEGALGEVANLHRFGVGHKFKPSQDWTMLSQYNLMWADENSFANGTGAIGSPTFSDSGNFRGHMLTGLLTYQCCKNFRTQFLVDYFLPGGYYDNSTNDPALFSRINMEWTF